MWLPLKGHQLGRNRIVPGKEWKQSRRKFRGQRTSFTTSHSSAQFVLAVWNSREPVGLGSHHCLGSLWLELCLLSWGQGCSPSFWGSLGQPLALPPSGGTVAPTQSVSNVGGQGTSPQEQPLHLPGASFCPTRAPTSHWLGRGARCSVPRQCSSCLGKSYFQRVGFNGPPSPPDF